MDMKLFHKKIILKILVKTIISKTRKTNSSYNPAPIERIIWEINSLLVGNIKRFCENIIKKYNIIPHKKPSKSINNK